MRDEDIQFYIDVMKYKEANEARRHLSWAFYITLGFFMTISGWYFASIKSLPFESFEGIIGVLFLLLLLAQAKISRIYSDNYRMKQGFDTKYEQKTTFDDYETGVQGVGDFIHYFILCSMTASFLIAPLNISLYCKIICCFAIILFLLISVYYILAGGHFICGKDKAVKSKWWQRIAYFLIIYLLVNYIFYIFYFKHSLSQYLVVLVGLYGKMFSFLLPHF